MGMNCEQARQHWHLFHDSEGDAELHQRINEHLSMCPECSRWFFQQGQLEDALSEMLCQGEPTAEMWDRVCKGVVLKEPAAARSRFLLGGVLMFAASLLIVVSLVLWNSGNDSTQRDPTQRNLTMLSVGLHENFASGNEEVKFLSSSHVEIEEYLRRQVPFPVRCPPRDDAGFQVEGGGVCKFDGTAVAYVVGRVDGQRVSVFIMSRESLASFPPEAAALKRDNTFFDHHRNCDVVMAEVNQNLVLVVGQMDIERLDRVLKAYGSYPEHSPNENDPAALQTGDSA